MHMYAAKRMWLLSFVAGMQCNVRVFTNFHYCIQLMFCYSVLDLYIVVYKVISLKY